MGSLLVHKEQSCSKQTYIYEVPFRACLASQSAFRVFVKFSHLYIDGRCSILFKELGKTIHTPMVTYFLMENTLSGGNIQKMFYINDELTEV